MPSPFPGMNPYLEQNDTWEDFHNNFICRAQEALGPQMGPHYYVKIEVRLILHELSGQERRFLGIGDLGIAKGDQGDSPSRPFAATASPFPLQLPAVEVERHAYLEIRDRRNRRVITVIEPLSPSNKVVGPDRDDYIAKRRQILAGHTHLVEIDLRRGGARPDLPQLPSCDYYALVSRYEERPVVGFWPIGLRDPLPVIPIPLAAPDPDAKLDLHDVLDRAYDAADYGKYIYSETPDPPLAPGDAAWAQQLLPH